MLHVFDRRLGSVRDDLGPRRHSEFKPDHQRLRAAGVSGVPYRFCCGLVSRIGSLFLRHSSICGCRLVRWLHRCHLVCLMISCSPLALLGEGTFAEIFRATEKAIVKDLVVKKMDQILYTNLGGDTSFHVLDGLRRWGEGSADSNGQFRLKDFEGPSQRWVVKRGTPFCVLMGGKGKVIPGALSISRVPSASALGSGTVPAESASRVSVRERCAGQGRGTCAMAGP